MASSQSATAKKLYFAFGSNLLKERITINNPSAEFVDIAKLEGYRLEFNYYSQRWRGAAATVNPLEECHGPRQPLDHVWGVLWQLHARDIPHLDDVQARTYRLIRPLEEDRRPSKVYRDVILRGARQNGIPQDYLAFLEGIEHNGYDSDVDVKLDLSRA